MFLGLLDPRVLTLSWKLDECKPLPPDIAFFSAAFPARVFNGVPVAAV